MTVHVPASVVGAGISGLVCAYALRKAGIETHVVETSSNPGGVIRSECRNGFLLEFGPQSFNATSALLALCRELQIDNQLVQAPSNAPRYVLMNGKLRAVPLSPLSFIASPLFNVGTKLQVLRDLLGHTEPPHGDESVSTFVRRKFSPELLEKLVGPFVSGIYAGDPEELSLRSAFPQLYEAERSSGSVVRGLLRAGKNTSTENERPTLQTFRNGNQSLVDALAANLGAKLRCGVEARRIRLAGPSGNTAAFEITVLANGQEQRIVADRLIVATPAPQAAKLLRDVDPQFETCLQRIEYTPLAVVSLGYSRIAIHHLLDGFGFLVPRSSNLRILGTVWNSSLFTDRAPEGHVLVTSFVGGATDPLAISLPEMDIIGTVHRELAPILGISQRPVFSNVWTYQRAIPQLNIGHRERVSNLIQLLTKYPNLWLTGNYLRGPSLGVCVEQALRVAQEAGKK